MSTTLDRAFPVAVKAHRCGSCDGPITAGEQYHRWKGTTDYTEGVVTLKECRECFERYANHRVWLNDENCAKAEAWLGYSLPSRETDQPKDFESLRETLQNILDEGFNYPEEYRDSLQEALDAYPTRGQSGALPLPRTDQPNGDPT